MKDRFTTRVFNLEVEDYHTYYVGRKNGVWVHNINCEPVMRLMNGKGILPTGKQRTLFDDDAELNGYLRDLMAGKTDAEIMSFKV